MTHPMELPTPWTDPTLPLPLEIVDPTRWDGKNTGQTLNEDTVAYAIDMVRNHGRNVVLVYPQEEVSPRYIHNLTFQLAEAQDSGTDFHISTMPRMIFDSLTQTDPASK